MIFVPSQPVANQKIRVINDCKSKEIPPPPPPSRADSNIHVYVNVESKGPTRPVPPPPPQKEATPPIHKYTPPPNKSIPPPNKFTPTPTKSTHPSSKSTYQSNKSLPPSNKPAPTPHPSNIIKKTPFQPNPTNSGSVNSHHPVTTVSHHSSVSQQHQSSYLILHPIQEPIDPYSVIEHPQCCSSTSSNQVVRPKYPVRRPILMNCELDCSTDGEAIDSIFASNSACCQDSDPFNLGATPTIKPIPQPTVTTSSNVRSPTSTNYDPIFTSANRIDPINSGKYQPSLESVNYNPHMNPTAYDIDPRNISNMTPSERLVFEEDGAKLKSQLYDLQLNYVQLEMTSETVNPPTSSITSNSVANSPTPITQVINNELLPGYTQIDFSESPQRHLKTGC